MASSRNLHIEERSRIVVLHEEGLNISQIANELNDVMLLVVIRASADHNMLLQKLCDGVVYRGTYYDKFRLFEGLKRPTNLLLHKYSKNLFFSHIIAEDNTNDTNIMNCHIKSKHCVDITKVSGGRAIAKDNYEMYSNLVYLGGNDGIYTYNVKNNELRLFAERGKSIWGLSIRRNFFYIEYPTKQLYTFIDGRFSKVPEVDGVEVEVFFVSNNFDIFFYNKTAFYVIDVDTKLTKILSKHIVVTQIIGDVNGDVYLSANDGVYMYTIEISKLIKIANIDNVYGLAFAGIVTNRGESHQLIYSDENSINMLVPSIHEKTCKDFALKPVKPRQIVGKNGNLLSVLRGLSA